jgi:hypothetical protein
LPIGPAQIDQREYFINEAPLILGFLLSAFDGVVVDGLQ